MRQNYYKNIIIMLFIFSIGVIGKRLNELLLRGSQAIYITFMVS